MKKQKCESCSKALISSDGTAHAFVAYVDRGHVTRPSKSAVRVCLESEKVFQRLTRFSKKNLPQGNALHERIASAVLSNTAEMNLFEELTSHQFESAVEDNHIHLLVKSVSTFYSRQGINNIFKDKRLGRVLRITKHPTNLSNDS